MRLDKPRVTPLSDAELDEEVRARFGGGSILNIFRTLARYPNLFKRWLVFGNHVLAKSSLTPRDRELAILRVGWLRRSGYEWAQHVEIALGCGISRDEIDRLIEPPDAPGWTESETTLIRATDELIEDAFIQDGTWAELERHFNLEQILDLIFAVGQYNLVSMALNSLGVQHESGERPRFPDE